MTCACHKPIVLYLDNRRHTSPTGFYVVRKIIACVDGVGCLYHHFLVILMCFSTERKHTDLWRFCQQSIMDKPIKHKISYRTSKTLCVTCTKQGSISGLAQVCYQCFNRINTFFGGTDVGATDNETIDQTIHLLGMLRCADAKA
jgi:hypothetical protein